MRSGWLWRDQVSKSQVKVVSGSSIRGFLYALLAGALGSLFNVGLAFGGPIQQAPGIGVPAFAMMSTAVWPSLPVCRVHPWDYLLLHFNEKEWEPIIAQRRKVLGHIG